MRGSHIALRIVGDKMGEIVLKLNCCASSNELTIMWFRGHKAIAGNEAVDQLDKAGSAVNFCILELRVALRNGQLYKVGGY